MSYSRPVAAIRKTSLIVALIIFTVMTLTFAAIRFDFTLDEAIGENPMDYDFPSKNHIPEVPKK